MRPLHSPLGAFSTLVIGIAVIGVPPLAATSYMPMTDSALADQAALIVEVRVVGLSPSPEDVLISTDYTVEVQRVLKGEPGGSTIVVRVPGGEHPSGVALKVFGAPVFEAGERALLFLRPKRRGHFAVEQLMLGAFHRVEADRSVFWLRDLSEAHEVNFSAGHGESAAARDRPRLAERFSSWLADRARGLRRGADYLAAASTTRLRSLRQPYQVRSDARWFAFDERQPVRWWTSSVGQPGLPGGGHQEFQRAVAAWNGDPDTNVSFTYAGESATIGDFGYYGGMDGLNVVAFEHTEFSMPFRCANGGMMSYSAVYTDWPATRPFRGREVHEIREADIATIEGVSCIFEREPDPTRRAKIAEELFGHAIGHVLGLGDSSTDPGETNIAYREALMYGVLHADGRGARLTADDRQGLRQLYGNPVTGVCRSNAAILCLQKNRFAVEAVFTNPWDGTGGNGRAIRSTDVAGFFSFFGHTNIELAIKILDFGDTFKVFYGQLTDLNFTLVVTDTRTGTVRAYGPAAGDCSGVDPAAFASGAAAHGAESIEVKAAPASACRPGRNTLCLLGGRFRAEVDWHNQFNDSSGRGQMIPQSDLTGLVYYGDKSNLEMVVKVLDIEGTKKLFHAPLSDLEYTLRVTDLLTQGTTTYRKSERESCGGQILSASPADGLEGRP